MTWLITGGSGQLGIAVSQELGARGILFQAVGSEELDITKGPIVRDFVSHLSPKVIVNCAAWTDVDGAETNALQASRVNSDGAANVAVSARECGAKLIHLSTDYVFSGVGNIPWEINDAKDPQSSYGRSKAEGEERVLHIYPKNSTIVRTAWLYSPWGKNFVKTMTRHAIIGVDEVRVVNDQIGQPTSARDLATQIVELSLSNGPAGIYHGTNSGQTSWFDLAQEIFRFADADIRRVVPISSSEIKRPAKRPSYSVLGHRDWANTTLQPMKDWQIALAEAMPTMISAVKAEQ